MVGGRRLGGFGFPGLLTQKGRKCRLDQGLVAQDSSANSQGGDFPLKGPAANRGGRKGFEDGDGGYRDKFAFFEKLDQPIPPFAFCCHEKNSLVSRRSRKEPKQHDTRILLENVIREGGSWGGFAYHPYFFSVLQGSSKLKFVGNPPHLPPQADFDQTKRNPSFLLFCQLWDRPLGGSGKWGLLFWPQ